jgi:hypothetical protein
MTGLASLTKDAIPRTVEDLVALMRFRKTLIEAQG